ncbi:MAG: class I SAM-dependent methyltransferase [Pseudomonadota bacterium]
MLGFSLEDLEFLRCPTCGGELVWQGAEDDPMRNGVLTCPQGDLWRVKKHIPNLADRTRMTHKERGLDVIYGLLAPFHDWSVDYFLPIVQYPDTDSSRENYIKAMALNAQDLTSAEGPIRILEVGAGTGANLSIIRNKTLDIEGLQLWAVDLNEDMIAGCARAFQGDAERLRLAHADAHQLPFADDTFDRVLHVGGINIYRDAQQGLAEMARVAKPGTPIVVVDEGLDETRDNTLAHKLAFKWLTSLDEFSHAPEELLPDGCELIDVYNASRFYYCLVYRKH